MSILLTFREQVRAWKLHVAYEAQTRSVQKVLSRNLVMLHQAVGEVGRQWSLREDGQLELDGKPLSGRNDVVDKIKHATGGVATIFAADMRLVTNITRADGTRAVGTRLAPGPAKDAVLGRGETYQGMADILGLPHLTIYEPVHDAGGRQVGILFVGVPLAETDIDIRKIANEAIIAGLAVIQLLWALAWHAVSGGLRWRRKGVASRADGLGDIGRSIKLVREGAIRTLETEKQTEAERAAKDAQHKAMAILTQDFGTAMSKLLADLECSAKLTRGVATEGVDAAERTAQAMKTTAADAEGSSSSLAAVAAATEQLTASVSEISRQVEKANGAARDAAERSRRTDKTVQNLKKAAAQIDDVVKLILSIARQTNLLALNATIEAARAGDAGKGFTVVATEVKQLAASTANATSRIAVEIKAIQNSTDEAVDAVAGVATAIDQVNEVANAIAEAVNQQGVATGEIVAQLHSVSRATNTATLAMREVCATAERTGQTSRSVVDNANHADSMCVHMRNELDQFLANLGKNAAAAA